MSIYFKMIFYSMVFSFFSCAPQSSQTISIGAKNFNEGYLLSEILAQLFESNGIKVERHYNLGGTLVCFAALNNAEIDIYPEYTGTISEQILHANLILSFSELRDEMNKQFGLEISEPFGFSNTYALAVKKKTAQKYGLIKTSDLRDEPDLRFAFSYEFLKRQDGWQNLAEAYQLPQSPVGIEHGLSYQAIEEEKIDLIDIYSTDGEIPRYDLQILEDDLAFFPKYMAVALYRSDLSPAVKNLIGKLENVIDKKKCRT